MEELVRTVISVLGGSGATAFGAWLLLKGKRGDQAVEETKVEATAADAFLKGQLAFSEFVEETVSKRVEATVAELRVQLEEMSTRLDGVQRESREMNDAIKSRETQLWLWNNVHGRSGAMPELPAPILERLGIGHLAAVATFTDPGPAGTD